MPAICSDKKEGEGWVIEIGNMDRLAICSFIFHSSLIIVLGIVYLVKQNNKIYKRKLKELQMTDQQYSRCKNIVLNHIETKELLPRNDGLLDKYVDWWWKNNKDKAFSESDVIVVSAIIHGVVMLYVIFYQTSISIPVYEAISELLVWGLSVTVYVWSCGFVIASLLKRSRFVGEDNFKTVGYWLKITSVCALGEFLVLCFIYYGVNNNLFSNDY